MQIPVRTRASVRNTPPALFPPILGALGLGLAWRAAGGLSPVAGAVGEVLAGMAVLAWVVAAGLYAVKLVLRPAVLMEELRVVPARAGVAAASMGAMLVAAALLPHAKGLAEALWWAGLIAQAGVALAVAYALATAPEGAPRWTPFLHLPFVGFIVAPIAGMPLGHEALSRGIIFYSGLAALVIYARTLPAMRRGEVPAPLRPALAIHLAPLSLLGIAVLGQGWSNVAVLFSGACIGLAAVLVLQARWIAEAGFSPIWGSLTFPTAAFASFHLQMATASAGAIGSFQLIFGAAGLGFATLLIPYVFARILRLWPSGRLAAMTNAATA